MTYAVDDASGYPTGEDLRATTRCSVPRCSSRSGSTSTGARSTNTLENTFVQRDGAWLLGAESVPGEVPRRPRAAVPALGAARSGSRSRGPAGWWWSRDLEGPVSARSLADDIAADIRFDAEALGMPASYDVLVDATTVGDAHEMNSVDDAEAAAVTFGVTNFAPDRRSVFAGMRIKVNPDQADAIAGDEQVMRHELTALPDPRAAGRRAHLGQGGAGRVDVDSRPRPSTTWSWTPTPTSTSWT